jgi:hypothetical protein
MRAGRGLRGTANGSLLLPGEDLRWLILENVGTRLVFVHVSSS